MAKFLNAFSAPDESRKLYFIVFDLGCPSNTSSRCRRHFDRFFRDNFRPQVACDIISSKIIEYVGADYRVKCVESMLNRSRDIPPKSVEVGIFGHFVLNFDNCRMEVASVVKSSVVEEWTGADV